MTPARGAVDPIRERFRLVRKATRLKQEDFARTLDIAARALLGERAPRYTQTRISDIERGAREITLDDVAVYAAIDPDGRGKLWLGWNEERSKPGPAVPHPPTQTAQSARGRASLAAARGRS